MTMTDGGYRKLFLFRMLPLLFVVCFVAWCSSSNHSRQATQPIHTELMELFTSSGLIDNASRNANLTDVARKVGESGMNRLLYDSAGQASLDALKWMVKNGADPKNIGAMQDLTLLQKVAKTPRYDRLEYFLTFGLNPLERTGEGATLLDIAAQGGLDERVLSLLQSKGMKITDADNQGRQAIHYAAVKSIPVLITAGADIGAKDQLGRTALHQAARDGKNDVAAELIRNGASVFEKDERGRTPLHLAAMRNNNDAVIDTLLAGGASVTVRDNDGMTAKEIAVQARKNDNNHYRSTMDKL
jgi:ankyrin repeat protein